MINILMKHLQTTPAAPARTAICILVFLLFILPGCTRFGSRQDRYYYHPPSELRFYDPQPIPIKEGVLPRAELCRDVSLVNLQDNTVNYLGEYTHVWHANYRVWTETAVQVMAMELKKRHATMTDKAEKVLFLTVSNAALSWRFWNIECSMTLRVRTPDGYDRTFEEVNVERDLYGSCDGVVTKAVTSVLQDEVISTYIAAVDTDQDRVADCRDECAATPCGVEVDSVGCPLDADKDGIYDYRDKCMDTPAGDLVNSHGCSLYDADNDSVFDHQDECAETPFGVTVDERGCPLDADHDTVPDYQDDCPATPARAEVDERGCPLDSDNDSVPDYMDQCPATPAGVKVGAQGCPLDSDGDAVLDAQDECPDTPAGVKVDARGCWVIDNVHFDFNQFTLKPESVPALIQVAEVLRRNPALRVEIQGHTDNIGSAAWNDQLSEKRARAVLENLLGQGIAKERLTAVGYGFSRPKAVNTSEAGRALNRRVELMPIH